ncbi:MAG: 4-hydroxy-tetrahydrodipicolinate reductase [Chitinivibrionia bacterium]|nr:4-hydroxy-tetrahydrodipicolinate reductase [Chitinivibrionia bacterium]
MKRKRTEPLGIIVHGACGRMGHIVVKLASASPSFRITAIVERPGHPLIGRKIAAPGGGSQEEHLVLDRSPDGASPADIVVDFSTKEALNLLLDRMKARRLRLVSGTTGLDDDDRAALKRYSLRAPVLHDANMSFGITVLKHLFREAHSILGSAFDTEIIELHHRHKKDFPSGTALSIAREVAPWNNIVTGRGTEERRKGDNIHIHSIRAGGITGEHTIVFSSDEEVLTLSHSALSRDVFARGALRAAEFLASRPKGLFSMKDVLEE